MKRLFYFILLIAGLSSIHSCKDLTDEEGNPLLDLNDNTGLIGPRALNREVTDVGIIAEYEYNGLLLSRVKTPKNSVTNVEWSGDKISKITFNGFVDSDGDGVLDTDSTSYTQQYTYGNLGRLTLISENRTVYRRGTPVPPATVGAYAVFAKTKTLHNLTYSSSTGKLVTIYSESGDDIPSFVYTNYSKAAFTYLGDNVSEVLKDVGALTAGVADQPIEKYGFEFTNYDNQINGYTLLPFAYKVSVLISTKVNDDRALIMSPNNPKRMAITDFIPAIPVTVPFSTDYRYDPQTYMTQGFGVNYFYKPL